MSGAEASSMRERGEEESLPWWWLMWMCVSGIQLWDTLWMGLSGNRFCDFSKK